MEPTTFAFGERFHQIAAQMRKRAEVEQLSAALVAHEEGAEQSDRADQDYVVAWDASARVDRAEEPAGDGLAPSYAIEEAGRAELRSHARTDGRDDQRETDSFREEDASGDGGDMHEGGLDFRLREVPIRPQQLGAIDLG